VREGRLRENEESGGCGVRSGSGGTGVGRERSEAVRVEELGFFYICG
jgi:hypothetical protein